ncbi:hypothetical protein AMTRI_Chr06g174870 [Amborella trichopoda]
MVKPKRKKLGAIAPNHTTVSKGLQPQNSELNAESEEENDWVKVKKQRITILLPPLPVSAKPPPQASRNKITRARSRTAKNRPKTASKHVKKDLSIKEKKSKVGYLEGAKSLRNEQTKSSEIHIREASINPSAKQPLLTGGSAKVRRITQEANRRIGIGESIPPSPHLKLRNGDALVSEVKCWNPRSQKNIIGLRKESTLPKSVNHGFPGSCPCIYERREVSGPDFINIGALDNQSRRVQNIERKLERAGGMSKWLSSLGLDRFVELFHTQKIDGIQLLELTMAKLKDMGANAVGPRRKLIHAIDNLSQPYYYKASNA